MQASIELSSPEFSPSETEAFHLLIVYEDSICCKSAQKTCDHILSQFDGDVTVTKSQWKFEVLRSRSLRELATEDARLADMIIIAAHGERDLCAELSTWVETWDQSNRDRALVAVLQTPSDQFVDCELNWRYLQGVARENGMDFFAAELEFMQSESE